MTSSKPKNSLLSQALPYILAVLAAFLATGIFLWLAGFDVLRAYQTILFTSLSSRNGFIQTLLKFVPLVLTALAFTIPSKANKFNIGSEGQLLLGATGAVAVGILFADLPSIILIPLCLLAGIICGGFWALVPAWLLYRFGINEILSTVLMNFISFQVIDYVATEIWRDPLAGHPTTIAIGENAELPLLVSSPPLHSGIIIVLIVAALVYFYTDYTSAGYELVATGSNAKAAKVYGINTRVLFVLALVLGGAMGGLAGAIEVTGNHHRLIEGMQSNFLPLGIIIGLLSRGNHAAIPFVAFFIAVLEVGASALQRTMFIPVELVFIVEALILIFVLLSDFVRRK
ncbi:MAG: ABC transporter permease [Chloroflexi bacterium]|nr:MAG: ABC transporter permease [Chloroflexota bacterium]MBL1196283.1 ABC transporter permease [Chloroflexota bacterium]NOH13578.1 ABC transporter permease [Chloroflexota bacterium]